MRVTRVLAPNPGPMTLEGTNTWVLAAPGGRSVVLDVGPDDPAHLRRVVDVATAGGRDIGAVLITHRHPDHFAGVAALTAGTGVALTEVAGGDSIDIDGLHLDVLATPGHTADSVTYLDPEEGLLFTGDTLLGRGTTVVAHPDGRLADYLESLELLAGVEARHIHPGHGPDVTDPRGWICYYRTHRAERLGQVRDAVAAGAATPRAVVEAVYADVDRALWPAAEISVAAQLDYLRERGELANGPAL